MARGEREIPNEARTGQDSILTRDFVRGMLKSARVNLKKDGFLQPVLFLRLQSGERGIMPLELPNTHEEQELYFTSLGVSMEGTGREIDEALFLSETWYVAQAVGLLDYLFLRP